MAKPISVYCPSCDAELKVRDPRTFGKRVRCPDCEAPFIVKPPRSRASGVDYVDYDDDRGYENSRPRRYEEYEPRPARSPRPPIPPRRSSPRGTDPGNQAVLVALGVLLGLLFLVGGGFLIYHLAGEKPGDAEAAALEGGLAKTETDSPRQINAGLGLGEVLGAGNPAGGSPLEWLSPRTQMLFYVDVDDVWRAPVVQGIFNQPDGAVLKLQVERAVREMGLTNGESLDAIESLHIGLEEIEQQPGFAQGLAVVKKRTPWDAEAVARKENARKTLHLGKTYYVGRLLAFYFPDPNTCLTGPRRFVEEAMSRGRAPDAARKFAFVPDAQVAIGVAPDDPSIFSKDADLNGPQFTRQIGRAASEIRTAAFTFDLSTRIQMDLLWNLTSPQWASQMSAGLQTAVGELRRMVAELQFRAGRLPPQFQQLILAAEPILNSAVSQERGNQVTLSAQVPAGVFQQIARILREQQGGRFRGFGPGDLF